MDSPNDPIARAAILLRAAFDMIRKAELSGSVESPLEMSMFYDGTDCDGTCLADDIAVELGIERDSMPLKSSQPTVWNSYREAVSAVTPWHEELVMHTDPASDGRFVMILGGRFTLNPLNQPD